MNTVLETFNKLIVLNNDWWQDDPKDLLTRFLSARDNIMPQELSEAERVWRSSSPEDIAQAEIYLNSVADVLPSRAAGELIYVLGEIEDYPNHHVTLLGPTIFPNDISLHRFINELRELVADHGKLFLTLEATVTVKGDRNAHRIANHENLQKFHEAIVTKATELGGKLLEPDYTGLQYMAHVTDETDALASTFEITVDSVSVSLHPGARLNIPHARNISVFKLHD